MASEQHVVETLERRLVMSVVVDFGAMKAYPAGPQPGPVVSADFNRDGKPDLAVAGESTMFDSLVDVVRILLGNGDGTFRAATGEIPAGQKVSDLVAGDFNGDGRLDLAASNDVDRASVTILVGDGAGGFRAGGSAYAGALAEGLATADFNRDGKLDLVVADAAPWSGEFTREAPSPGAAVLLGNGDGTFKTAAKIATDAVLHHVATADFNTDGAADVLLAGPPAVAPAVMPGTTVARVAFGDGAGGTFRVGPGREVAGQAVGVAVGDLNRDARPDVAMAMDLSTNVPDGNSAVAVLFNRRTIGVAPAGDDLLSPSVTLKSGTPGVRDIAIADYDLNGLPDIAVAGLNPFLLPPFDVGTLSVLQNRGYGRFADPVSRILVGYPARMAGSVSFDGDPLPDVAVTTPRGGSVAVLLNETKTMYGRGFAIRARAGVTLTAAPVAGFAATGGPVEATAFTAKINWGDGTAESDGTVVAMSAADNVFHVLGTHKYARPGEYLITVEIAWPAAGASLRLVGAAVVF